MNILSQQLKNLLQNLSLINTIKGIMNLEIFQFNQEIILEIFQLKQRINLHQNQLEKTGEDHGLTITLDPNLV